MARLATTSKKAPPKPNTRLPDSLIADLERRRAGLARHMARAVVAVVRWDDSTGVPPQQEAIAKTCEAGLDLFLATAREARPAAATSEPLSVQPFEPGLLPGAVKFMVMPDGVTLIW